MWAHVARRSAMMVPTLLVVSIIVFALIRAVPEPAALRRGEPLEEAPVAEVPRLPAPHLVERIEQIVR